MIVDPMTAMYAAVEAVRGGGVPEIELDWNETGVDAVERHLGIAVRAEVRHYSPVVPDDE